MLNCLEGCLIAMSDVTSWRPLRTSVRAHGRVKSKIADGDGQISALTSVFQIASNQKFGVIILWTLGRCSKTVAGTGRGQAKTTRSGSNNDLQWFDSKNITSTPEDKWWKTTKTPNSTELRDYLRLSTKQTKSISTVNKPQLRLLSASKRAVIKLYDVPPHRIFKAVTATQWSVCLLSTVTKPAS